MSKIYQVYGNDAHNMTYSLMRKGDIKSKIPSIDSKIVLKPNLVTDSTPEQGATTHKGVLSGAIQYLQDNGFYDIEMCEGSWVGTRTQRAYNLVGYQEICEEYNVPFFDLKNDETRSKETPIGRISICKKILDCDYLIDLPVLKGHGQTLITCAMKNLKGCIPDHEKRRFHSEGLHAPIAALNSVLKPNLIIVDSICGDLDFEEGGTPVETNRMYMGFDAVQIDAYGCKLMGLEIKDVPYISYGETWGAGSTEIKENDIVYLNKPTETSLNLKPSGIVARITRNVKQDNACSACFANLVRALYNSEDYNNERIYIGQGNKGKKIDGIGIGNCCSGCSKFVKGCPPTANDINDFFKKL